MGIHVQILSILDGECLELEDEINKYGIKIKLRGKLIQNAAELENWSWRENDKILETRSKNSNSLKLRSKIKNFYQIIQNALQIKLILFLFTSTSHIPTISNYKNCWKRQINEFLSPLL